MQPLPKIPGYELVRLLGGGPLTQVFSARECATGSDCAVKLLRDDWADQPTGIKLIQREARVGLLVRHPHLVQIRYAHVTRPPYFLVMELLPGESVRARLRRDYRLDVSTALWIARQSAEALAALHRAGFIHGDVKPENIRLIDDGTAVLIDLGFAHRPGENTRSREQGYVLGTVNYLAPELCAFEDDTDPRSDLFSLGVTLFEMLTGHFPYPTGAAEEVLRLHAAESPHALTRFRADVPAGLAQLIDRLLRRPPNMRPRAALVVQQLVSLEIVALGRRLSA